jgi:hypothetical protein
MKQAEAAQQKAASKALISEAYIQQKNVSVLNIFRIKDI